MQTGKANKTVKEKLKSISNGKWFWYIVIVLSLSILVIYLWIVSLTNEMALRFLPTFVGILFTFVSITLFFKVREYLEWKKVEDRVKRKIGRQLLTIFSNLEIMILVDDLYSKDYLEDIAKLGWSKRTEKQLNNVLNDKIALKPIWKDPKMCSQLSEFVEDREKILSEIEGKYGKFDSQIQASLMDIEEYLHKLSFELTFYSADEEQKENTISELIKKITVEIQKLMKIGIKVFD
jgi:hypothetical protein